MLVGDAECIGQVLLAHCKHNAAHAHAAADMLVDGAPGHKRTVMADPLAKAISKNRPDAGTFDIPIQRAIFGQGPRNIMPIARDYSRAFNLFYLRVSRRATGAMAGQLLIQTRLAPLEKDLKRIKRRCVLAARRRVASPWQRRTNVWQKVTSPTLDAKRLRSGSANERLSERLDAP